MKSCRHHFVCALWFSRITRGQFCADCLCQRLFEMSLPGGVHGGNSQQSADGFLSTVYTQSRMRKRHGLKVRPVDVVKVAGWVIVRQRPGTAKGFVFLSMEDETGIANIIVTPQLFETNRAALVNYPLLIIEGVLQHQDNVVSVKARRVEPMQVKIESPGSHDFH
jgi:DNA polymerase III alpha subunit